MTHENEFEFMFAAMVDRYNQTGDKDGFMESMTRINKSRIKEQGFSALGKFEREALRIGYELIKEKHHSAMRLRAHKIRDLIAVQGWNDETLAGLYYDFIVGRGLEGDLLTDLEKIAAEENAEIVPCQKCGGCGRVIVEGWDRGCSACGATGRLKANDNTSEEA